tara:strand:- start:482 stop:988 length:507 start_codon:yes stop_codon:yes gene_type:complete
MVLNGNKKRGSAPKPLASHVVKLTKPIFGERGFADASIISDWPEIAGEYLANHCVPEKINYPTSHKKRGTLHLRIDNGGLAIQLQHLEALVIERINAYFGFGAVESIRITQGPLPKIPKNTFFPPRPLSEKEEQNLLDCLSDVADDDLHKALERLGRAILSKTSRELP